MNYKQSPLVNRFYEIETRLFGWFNMTLSPKTKSQYTRRIYIKGTLVWTSTS